MKERKSTRLARMILAELETLQNAHPDLPMQNILTLTNEILRDAKGLAVETLKSPTSVDCAQCGSSFQPSDTECPKCNGCKILELPIKLKA